MAENVVCSCPTAGTLVSIPKSVCKFNIEQVQKLLFQEVGQSFTESEILELATFIAFLSATDKTKLVATPLIGANPNIVAGTPITQGGGDNSTLNGEEIVMGTNPSLFSCDFHSLTPEQESAMKMLKCNNRLGVIMVTQHDELVVEKFQDGEVTKYRPIPISAYFLSDRNNNGFGSFDVFNMRFSLKAGWSEKIAKIKPTDYSPLLDLDA